MDLGSVMDAVAERLRTIDGWTVYAYPPGRVTPPAAIVSYPDTYTFDGTYARGMDQLVLPVVVVVGKVSDRSARDLVGAYCNGSGTTSVKATLDGGGYSAFDSARVTSAEFDVVMFAGSPFLAAIFDVEIIGQGA